VVDFRNAPRSRWSCRESGHWRDDR
jgi:hypothetical protein